jgi:hypothetical protein
MGLTDAVTATKKKKKKKQPKCNDCGKPKHLEVTINLCSKAVYKSKYEAAKRDRSLRCSFKNKECELVYIAHKIYKAKKA